MYEKAALSLATYSLVKQRQTALSKMCTIMNCRWQVKQNESINAAQQEEVSLNRWLSVLREKLLLLFHLMCPLAEGSEGRNESEGGKKIV